MDTLTAQLFVIAAKSWASDQQSFKISHPSERVLSTLDRLGLSAHVELEGTSYDD
jgi:anti-anti-sigma regulatory factor